MADTLDAEAIERALVDPAAVFRTPGDVVSAPSLDRATKVAILRRWEYDARELQVADGEGMQGGERTEPLLEGIIEALHALGADAAFHRDPD